MALKQMSMPRRAATASAWRATASRSRASSAVTCAAPPPTRISSAVASSTFSLRPTRWTTAPSRAYARATREPIAPAAPYTTAVFAWSSTSCLLGTFEGGGVAVAHAARHDRRHHSECRAGQRRGVQTVGEGRVRGIEQAAAHWLGQRARRVDGAAQWLIGARRRFGGQRGADVVPIDRASDRAQHRDAQRSPEFRRRLGDSGGCARTPRGHRADDEVSAQRPDRANPETDERRAGDDRREPGPGIGARENAEPDRSDQKAGSDDQRRPVRADEQRRKHRSGDDRAGGRQAPQPGFERPESEHELQILSGEELDPNGDEGGGGIGGQGGAESRRAEQREVEQGFRQHTLAGGKRGTEEDA